MRDFPYLRLGIRDFKAKSGRYSGLKVCAGGGVPKITLGITGLPEILGRDYGIVKPYWGPAMYLFCQKWYIKGLEVGPRGRASPYEALLSTLPPSPGG